MEYVQVYVNQSPAAAAALGKAVDAVKAAEFIKSVEVRGWIEAEKAYSSLNDPNYGKKFALLAVDFRPYRTADGNDAEMIYIDWKVNAEKPVRAVYAKITTLDAKGRVIRNVASQCIYTAPADGPGFGPYGTYKVQDGKGLLQPFNGVPKIARVNVVIINVVYE